MLESWERIKKNYILIMTLNSIQSCDILCIAREIKILFARTHVIRRLFKEE